MYYDCNLYLFTFLVSYNVILVAYDCVNGFSCVLIQRESCHFKVGGILNFKPIRFLVLILQVQTELFSHVWDFSIKAG